MKTNKWVVCAVAILVGIIGFGGISSAAAAKPTPDEIYAKALKAFEGLKNYGFIVLEYENDRLWKKAQQKARDEHAGLAKDHGVEGVEAKEEFKKSTFQMAIIKPFTLQLKILESDYTPKPLWGGAMTYKPASDPKNYVFLPKVPPVPVNQPITSETGSFLLQNWTVELIRFDQFRKNAREVKVTGEEKVANRDCWVIEMKGFPAKMKLDYNLEKWKVPKEARFKIDAEFKEKAQAGITMVKYWFDKKDLVAVQREHYINGQFFGRWTYNKIRINNIQPF